MRRLIQFLVITAVWVIYSSLPAAEGVAVCTGAGALVRDNWGEPRNGWYCSPHPGDSEHLCSFDQASMCATACSDCGKTFVSSNYCLGRGLSDRARMIQPRRPTAVVRHCGHRSTSYHATACRRTATNRLVRRQAACASRVNARTPLQSSYPWADRWCTI
jgi:hypothetical protein